MMGLVSLSPQAVRFRGPALSRRARGALSAAGISLIERQASTDWGGQLQEFLVSVEARDAEDAMHRVRRALENDGAYASFTAERREPTVRDRQA